MTISGSSKGNIIYWLISIMFMLVLFEILSSLILIYTYRLKDNNIVSSQAEVSYFSSVNLINIIATRVGLSGLDSVVQYNKKTVPDPFIIPDPVMGYGAAAGEYTHTFLRKKGSQKDWESFKTKVTINKDGSRWTGNIDEGSLPKIYIFGDSFVFGTGVNDEQTFSYHLQSALPQYEIKLFALGGYSLSQAYLRIQNIEESITSSDMIILGYADFYDERHAMSPGRVRAINNWTKRKNPDLLNESLSLLRFSVDEDGEIQYDYVNRNCSENDGYCDQADLDAGSMTKLTAILINHIADNTRAKVHLVHFDGKPDNPVFESISEKVTRISALPGDFDYFIRDDIEGFDQHPGPYWHYAISRKLLESLPVNSEKQERIK